ncbi:MAG: ImmA/IrrE family metallo-endopeptidase [Nannocystaceae bacterium]|nr:ImmA/IrrE family metallo-endopeptidase [bacterium]
MAKDILEDLQIRDASELNVELIAAHYGAITRYRPLQHEQGHIVRRGSNAVIVVDARLEGQPRARWVVAHELGHFRLHAGADQYEACTTADLSDYHSSGREPEANHFAAELLMPSQFFKPDCDRNRPDLNDVRELAAKYGTSLIATAIRLARFSPEPCAAVVSRNAKVMYSSRSETWRYYLPNGHNLSGSSYAGDIFSGKDPQEHALNVEASAWTTNDWASEHDLREHSMPLGMTGLVLTMLWAPEL